MNKRRIITIIILIIPFLFILLLRRPYAWVMGEYLVDRFGCCCTNPEFNTNHITTIVWYVISGIAALISIPCAFRIPKDLWPLRIVYIGVCAWLCYHYGNYSALRFMLK